MTNVKNSNHTNKEGSSSKREKFHNNLPRLKSIKMLDSINLNLDSPLFSKACKNLGINPAECIMQSYETF